MQGQGDKVSKITNIRMNLGPRLIMLGAEPIGTSDNISIEVAEATEEELKRLISADKIWLVKMPVKSPKERR